MREQRRRIVRGLSNINTLNFCVVLLVAALALVAVVLGLRARDDAEKLWAAVVTQARASRFGGEIGWKSNVLASIAAASEVRPSLALRNEAIAALATVDLHPAGRWHPQSELHYRLVYDPDLRTAAVGELDGTVRWIDLESGAEKLAFKCPGLVEAVAFDATGTILAARSSGGNIRLWRLPDGQELLSTKLPHDQSTLSTLEFSGSSLLASAAEKNLYSFPLTNLAQPRVIQTTALIEVLAAVPGGENFAFSTASEIRICAPDGSVQRTLRAPGHVSSLAWTSSGKHLAAGTVAHKVHIWNMQSGEMQTLEGHQGTVFQLAFNRGGTQLASCAFGGTTRVWEVSSGALLLGTESLFIDRFGRDESLVGCVRTKAGYGVFRLWNSGIIANHALFSEPDKAVYHVIMLDENRALAARESGAQLKDLDTGRTVQLSRAPRSRGALPWGGDKLITASHKGLQVWPLEPSADAEPKPLETIPLKEGLANESLFLGRDQKSLLARLGFRGAVLLDLETKKVEAVFNVPNIGQGLISPDGKWIAISTFHGHGTRVFDRSGKLIKHLNRRDAGLSFSPDGRWLAAASSDECEIYETGSWERRHRLEMESASGLPTPVAFSPDSSILAFTRQRRTIRLVNPENGAELASLVPPQPLQLDTLAWTPSGGRLVAGAIGSILQVWEIAKLREDLGNLNWPDASGRAAPPWKWHENISTLVVAVAALTLGAALLYSLVAWIRHRQFLASYARVERMIDDRNQELAAAQTELFQGQKMRALGTLAAGIAHDFNNLLSIIRMSNRLTAEEARGNPEIEENVQLIEKAVGQGKEVVRSMLGYSRGAGAREEYAPDDVVRQTLSLVSQQFLQGIHLKTEFASNVPRVNGVRNRLEQILLNLIVNAAEAMKGSGELRVSVRPASLPRDTFALRPRDAGEYVEITIADSGPGISEEARPRIFEPFFTTKIVGAERGTGLGLSMVYSVAEEEGIGIHLQTGAGRGTLFRLYLGAPPAKSMLTSPPVHDTVAA